MTSLVNESTAPAIRSVRTTAEKLEVRLQDGRVLSVPLDWYPRLAHGSPAERRHWELIANGTGVHWPALDEDISVAGLLAGLRSGERPASFRRWLQSRAQPPNKRLHTTAAVRESRAPYKSASTRRRG